MYPYHSLLLRGGTVPGIAYSCIEHIFLHLSASTVKIRVLDPYSFDTDPTPGPVF